MAWLKSSASPSIVHHFLTAIRLPSPPLRTTTSLSSRSLLFSSPSLSLPSYPLPLPPYSLSTSQPTLETIIKYETGEFDDEDDEFEAEIEDFESEEEEEEEEEDRVLNYSPSIVIKESNTKLPLRNLTVKEKKELDSYAHSPGKKLKSQQVGKSGVTDSVATAPIETLEANELLKLKMASRQAEKQILPEPQWGFCYTMLHKVSLSFAVVIQQLDLRNAVDKNDPSATKTLSRVEAIQKT